MTYLLLGQSSRHRSIDRRTVQIQAGLRWNARRSVKTWLFASSWQTAILITRQKPSRMIWKWKETNRIYISVCRLLLAFIDNCSRGVSRKKRPAPVDNHEETLVEIKVHQVSLYTRNPSSSLLEPIDVGYSSCYPNGRSNVDVAEHDHWRWVSNSPFDQHGRQACL